MHSRTVSTGRLTRDPEQKQAGQNMVTRFSIAIDDGYGDKKKTDFQNVSAWGKTGDSVMKFVKKGHIVTVDGKFVSSKSNDITYWELRADTVSFITGDKKADAQPQANYQQQPQQPQYQQPQQPQYQQPLQQPQYQAQGVQPQYVQQPQYDPNMYSPAGTGDDNLPF